MPLSSSSSALLTPQHAVMRVNAAAAGRSTALASTSAALPLPLSSTSLMQRRRRAASPVLPLRASASPPTSTPAPSSELSDAALEERSKIQKMLDRLVTRERKELNPNNDDKKTSLSGPPALFFFFSTSFDLVNYLPTFPNPPFPRLFPPVAFASLPLSPARARLPLATDTEQPPKKLPSAKKNKQKKRNK